MRSAWRFQVKQTATGEATAKSEQAPAVFQCRGQVHIPPWAFPIPVLSAFLNGRPIPSFFLLVSCKISNIHLQPPKKGFKKNTRTTEHLPQIPITPKKTWFSTTENPTRWCPPFKIYVCWVTTTISCRQNMIYLPNRRYKQAFIDSETCDMLVKSSTSTYIHLPWKSPGNPLEVPMESPIHGIGSWRAPPPQ